MAKSKRKRKIREDEIKVYERYPEHPDERTCSDLRERRNGLRDMYRIRLQNERKQ